MEEFNKKQLYLLPIYTDHTYEASAMYFIKKLIPIQSLNEIPIGRRACWLIRMECPNCLEKKVRIIDFLYSRQIEIVKEVYEYDYHSFKNFFTQQQNYL